MKTATSRPDRGGDLRREASWRLREWGFYEEEILWRRFSEDVVEFCLREDAESATTCLPLRSVRATTASAAADAIDAWATEHWRGRDVASSDSIYIGVPVQLADRADGPSDLRDIDKVFWALTVIKHRASRPTFAADIEWLSARYGLQHRAGRGFYGQFVRTNGEAYDCDHSTTSAKYDPPLVGCVEVGGSDRLFEGH